MTTASPWHWLKPPLTSGKVLSFSALALALSLIVVMEIYKLWLLYQKQRTH